MLITTSRNGKWIERITKKYFKIDSHVSGWILVLGDTDLYPVTHSKDLEGLIFS